MRHHLGKLGFTSAGWAIKQHIDAGFFTLNGIFEQTHKHLHIVLYKMKIFHCQSALHRWPGEHRHQLALITVFAHEHRRELLADLHQIGQIGDVVFRN